MSRKLTAILSTCFHVGDWPLASKIAAMGIALCALLALTMGILGYVQATAGLDEQAVQALGADARVAATQVDDWNASRLKHLRAIAALPALSDLLRDADEDQAGNQAYVQQVLDSTASVLPDSDSIGVLDLDGTFVISSNPLDVGQNVRQRDYFQAGRDGRSLITGVSISTITFAPAIFHSVPVLTRGGASLGVVRSRSSLEQILASVASAEGRIGPGSTGVLLDGSGLVIARGQDSSWQLRPVVPLAPAVADALRRDRRWGGAEPPEALGQTDLAQAIGIAGPFAFTWRGDGPDRRAYAAPLRETRWTYVAALPVASIQATAQRIAESAGVVACIAVLLAWALAVLVARGISRKAARLALEVRRISEEDIPNLIGFVKATSPEDLVRSTPRAKRLSLNSRDEMGKLAQDFNRIVDGLEAAREAARSAFTDLLIREREARERLEHGNDELTHAMRVKSEFLATMSHEIRTPMNGMIGMTGLLLDSPLSNEQREVAETVRSSGEALLTIINDILDFSKIEAGRLEIELIPFDLMHSISDVMELLAEPAQKKGLELTYHVPADVPVAILGDPGRLRQILTNLVGNAIKFTDQGEVVLSLGVVSSAGRAFVVRFEVRDTGIGIPEAAQRRLFNAFTQVDSPTTRKYGGTGLGLAICRQLVELMGGRLGLDSAPGQGSTFWFTLPLTHETLAPPTPPRGDLRDLRVLIVDDNATNRAILSHQVESWGMAFSTAGSGHEALEKLRAASSDAAYDLAILDMQMPEMDGLMLARAIKTDRAIAHTRLVLLTSIGQRGHSPETLAAGIEVCLSKPVRQSQLFDTLATVMGSSPACVAGSTADTVHPPSVRPTVQAVRVLLAEDNAVNQRVAVHLLQKLGYQVDVVANGREAVEALGRIRYPLVLMDCQMPELDGYAATEEIRVREGTTRHTRIIAMTAAAMAGDRELCLAAGMDDYITKPVRQDALSAILELWLPASAAPGTMLDAAMQGFTVEPVNEPISVDSTPMWAMSELALDSDVLKRLTDPACGGDPDFFVELVTLFRAETPPMIHTLDTAAVQGDAATLARVAHTLKGSSAYLGAARLRGMCEEIEQLSRAGDVTAATVLVRGVRDEVGIVMAALERASGAFGEPIRGEIHGQLARAHR